MTLNDGYDQQFHEWMHDVGGAIALLEYRSKSRQVTHRASKPTVLTDRVTESIQGQSTEECDSGLRDC